MGSVLSAPTGAVADELAEHSPLDEDADEVEDLADLLPRLRPRADVVSPRSSGSYFRRIVEFQWFLMALSVLRQKNRN